MHKINDVEADMQSTHVQTRRVHDNLHKHTCISIIIIHNKPGSHARCRVYELYNLMIIQPAWLVLDMSSLYLKMAWNQVSRTS